MILDTLAKHKSYFVRLKTGNIVNIHYDTSWYTKSDIPWYAKTKERIWADDVIELIKSDKYPEYFL